MERIGQYKKRTAGFGNIEEAKLLRVLQELERRKHRRSDLFTSNREITEPINSPGIRPAVQENQTGEKDQDNAAAQIGQDDRATKLAKWRAERQLQKKLQQMKKPAFHTGVYTHKLDSPIFLHQIKPAVKQAKAGPIVGRITRATAKRLAVKNDTTTMPSAGIGTLRVKKATHLARGAKKNLIETSFAPQNHQFRAPDGLPPLPLFGQEALEITEKDTTVRGAAVPPPVYFSPYVVTARGKRASRIEQLHILNTSNSAINKMEEEEALALEVKEKIDQSNEEDRTVGQFRNITDTEVMRLKARCYDWIIVKSNPDLSEDAALTINQVIGQTNLLITKKIEQFRKLINDCEAGSGEKLVTCDDLQGFWDMIYMQVKDCDLRFDKLAKLQADDWIERGEEKVTKPTVKKKPSVAATKKNTSRSSSVRQMILAARKKQMETQANPNLTEVIMEAKKPSPIAEPSRLSSVKFDGGFFVVESPQKSATPRSTRKASLAIPKTPENLSVSKLRHSALSAIKISQILKPLEIKTAEPEIKCVNRGQTPGKSILKEANSTQTVSCGKKSQNKVNFFKYDKTVPEMDCAEDSSADLLVKKRLEFLNLSSSESEPEEQHASCSQETASCSRIPEIKELEQDERTPTTNNNSKRVTRQSSKSVLDKVDQLALSNAINIQSTEPEARCVAKSSSTKTDDHKENREPDKLEITKRRRSTRKSVKFTGEECTACAETKQVLPMTPGSKRRTSKNPDKESLKAENRDRNTVEPKSGDLISFETPSQVSQRLRRSPRVNKAEQ